MSAAEVVVHRDATLLARAAHLVLTGGGMGIAVLAELASSAARDAIDWPHLDVWWGDERFVPAGNPDRNDTAARSALLDHVPVDPARVHAMPSSDGPDGDDPEAAAARYAAELANAAAPEDRDLVPTFDVLMLGVGEDGHVASLFPGMPALFDTRRVVAVRGAPKPPPVRVTMTFPSIRAAQELWLITSGAAKAAVVSLALGGAGEVEVPAAGARGRQRTLWLLDEAAASRVPRALSRIASP